MMTTATMTVRLERLCDFFQAHFRCHRMYLPLAGCVVLLATSAAAQTTTDDVINAVRAGDSKKLAEFKKQSSVADERFFISAVLESDGEVAKSLYEKVLKENPNSAYKPLCTERLAEYAAAVGGKPVASVSAPPAASAPVASPTPAVVSPVVTTSPATITISPTPVVYYTLQFGSFSTQAAAQKAAKKIKARVTAKAVAVVDASGNTAYKVRLDGGFKTKAEAKAYAAKLHGLSYYIVEY
jgi:hypothetical protein